MKIENVKFTPDEVNTEKFELMSLNEVIYSIYILIHQGFQISKISLKLLM